MFQPEIREHRVKYGETLTSISQAFYGTGEFALAIYQHNKHYIENPNRIYPGQVLVIPHLGNAVKVGS